MTQLPTDDRPRFDSLIGTPTLAPLAADLLWQARRTHEPADYLAAVLPKVLSATGGDYLAVATANQGRWSPAAQAGDSQPLPEDLLADTLDRHTPGSQDDWVAAPLSHASDASEALVLHCRPDTNPSETVELLRALAGILDEGMTAAAERRGNLRRIDRLETVLQISSGWNKTQEVTPLLVEMAEAATRLFEADRASIFVWDRRNHTLVGRPALGVQGGELRIPDDRGVVGQVIQGGQPMRVDAASEPKQIDPQVDSQLGYQTKTLLCVPLCGRSGKLLGAFELINKLSGSFTAEDEAGLIELATHAAVALENTRDREELLWTSRQMTEQAAGQVQLIGRSRPIEALRSVIGRVADTDLAVLLLGENGTGKEVVAKSIHYLSIRRQRPFVGVNCAAIPDSLAESELFGHEKGAFTDAQDTRQGKFELAADGTLMLDEIGDLSPGCQAKLLRVLEEKVLIRVGGSTPIHTDARVIAATNQKLAEMVREKRFREDLYFRLNVVTLELPPLRERVEDIMLLAEHFLGDFCRKAHRPVPQLTPGAIQRLETHAWPGNVRELRNLMERLAYLSTEDRVEADDLAFILSPRAESQLLTDFDQPLADATVEFQAQYITRAIDQAGGNVSKASARLGLHRSNLYRKMRQLGMTIPK